MNVPGSTNTQVLGLNDLGQVVGTYTDASNAMHGFVYSGGNFQIIDDPLGIGSTMINGINNKGQIAEFLVDASGVTLGAAAVPELSTFSLRGLC